MSKAIYLLMIVAVVIGCAFGRPQFGGFGGHRPLPGNFGGAGFGGPSFGGAFSGQNPFNTAGLGGGFAQNSQVIGTGTGIANPGPGGVGIGLGVGGAVASPVGNFAIGQGTSTSVGK